MILVNSNVVLDIVTQDPIWYPWSAQQLKTLRDHETLVINPIIYTEISISFHKIEELDSVLLSAFFKREEIPYEACFLAGKIFINYKKTRVQSAQLYPIFLLVPTQRLKDIKF